MYGGAQAFQELHYGFDLEAFYLRLDPAESPARSGEVADRLQVQVLAADRQTAIDLPVAPDGALRPGGREGGGEAGRVAFQEVLEAAVPFAALGLAPGVKVALSLHLLRGEVEV
jgi:hypothetical protein